jgi:hypothetical protein
MQMWDVPSSDDPAVVVPPSLALDAGLHIVCVDAVRCLHPVDARVDSDAQESKGDGDVQWADAVVHDVAAVYRQAVDLTTRAALIERPAQDTRIRIDATAAETAVTPLRPRFIVVLTKIDELPAGLWHCRPCPHPPCPLTVL